MRWLMVIPVILLTGCGSINITNLTPSTLPRNPDGNYPIEMVVDSNQQSLRFDSIQPFVVMGWDFYPMVRTLNMNNRWEVLVPIPADQNIAHYRFKLNYEYNDFGKVGQGSKMSTEYKLTVKE
jgi:hypothetical protein